MLPLVKELMRYKKVKVEKKDSFLEPSKPLSILFRDFQPPDFFKQGLNLWLCTNQESTSATELNLQLPEF